MSAHIRNTTYASFVAISRYKSVDLSLKYYSGPSGLVTAKYLLESTEPTYQVKILESAKYIGGSFVNKVYDNCRLVSSKYLTAFSEFRMQEDTADHPSAAE